jgi:hypothetical protein
MAGLVPAIHVLCAPPPEYKDARHKAGHDELLRQHPISGIEFPIQAPNE